MSKKKVKEWTLAVPWGNLALISWGRAVDPPILLVHGFMDTAATFIPLMEELPNSHYYVGFDMPGHGKSDPFAPGILVSQLSIVDVIRRIIEHLKWQKFDLIAHSMGAIIGLYYNHSYPGKITKMVYLDPGQPLSMYYYIHWKPDFWFTYHYNEYYENYERWNSNNSKSYTHEDAVSLMARNRNITEDQAELVLTRSLVKEGENEFKFSWEPRMKKIVTPPISAEILYHIIATSTAPTLIIKASRNKSLEPGKTFVANLMDAIQDLPNYIIVKVNGGHDVHITNPDVICAHISDFFGHHLGDKRPLLKCKL